MAQLLQARPPTRVPPTEKVLTGHRSHLVTEGLAPWFRVLFAATPQPGMHVLQSVDAVLASSWIVVVPAGQDVQLVAGPSPFL